MQNVEYFSYLGSTITNDTRCRPTPEITSSIAIANSAFNKKTLFTWKID
jgi:hypothetical protein